MWVKVFILNSLLVALVFSENHSNCKIDGINDADWSVSFVPTIYDNQIDVHIFEGTYSGKIDNLLCNCSSCPRKYIEFETNATHFFISTTQEMLHFDEDMLKLLKTTTQPNVLSYRCTMTCEDATKPSDLLTVVTVNDYNDYAPEFVNASRLYKVPSPIMPGVDITAYGDQIQATDMDFTNKDIKYSIAPDDFVLVTSVDVGTTPETYTVNFRAKEVMQLTEIKKYTVTATDTGTYPGPKDSTIEISLTVDESNTLDTPTFVYANTSVPSYSFRYEENNTLTILGEAITVKTNKPEDIQNNLMLSGDLSDHFLATFNQNTGIVSLAIQNNVDTNLYYTILTLSLKTDFAASTPIIIYFSNAPDNAAPKFSRHFYTGSYDDAKNVVTVDQLIQVTSTGEPEVKVTGEWSGRFSLTLDAASKSYKIKVTKPLTVDEMKSNVYLNVTIEATVDKESDTSGLLISLPSHNLEFTQILYNATYNEDDTVTVDATSPIALTSNHPNVAISVDDTYSKYFNITYATNKYGINVITPLPDDILAKFTEIAFTITAQDEYKHPEAVVKLSLPVQNTAGPNFSRPYYVVQYQQNQTGYIDFDLPVSFDNVADDKTVSINLSSYGEYFKAVYVTNKWRLNVVKSLETATITNKSELLTTMEASTTNVEEKGMAVLVIEIIDASVEEKIPEFAKDYYTATYPKSGKGSFFFDEDISFENVDDFSKVTINLNDYSDYFEITYDTSVKKFKITIQKSLNDSILQEKTYLATTMFAKIISNTNIPTATFVLNLPKVTTAEAPAFNRTYYKASYSVDGNNALVNFEDYIGFTNEEDMSEIKIVSDEYANYFTFMYINKNWQIKSNKIDAGLLNKTDLIISITATNTTNKLEGHSVIDLKLPSINADDTPKFSETYYTGRYLTNATVSLDTDITILSDINMNTVKITTDQYTENFNFTYTDGKWILTVKKDLDPSVIDTEVDIVMALIATTTSNPSEKGESTLVLTLPSKDNEQSPQFSDVSYQSTCDAKTKVLDTEIKITNKNDLTKINVYILEDEYKSNFDVTFKASANSWFVNVNSLPQAISSSQDLVLTLIAVENNNLNSGKAALVIQFPVLTAPEFSKAQYFGRYTNWETPTLEIDDIQIVNKDNQDDIGLNISSDEGDFSNNFNFNYDKNDNTWIMNVTNALDKSKFKNKTELVLTVIGTEDENDNTGKATIILYLPNNVTADFSEVYYTGSYNNSGNAPVVKLDENIQVTSSKDISGVDVKFESSDDFNPSTYFALNKISDHYEVSVETPLTEDILQKQRSLVMTLEADLDDSKSYATLVIDLPAQTIDQSVAFDNILYNGEYNVSLDGQVVFSVDPVTLITDDDVSVVISEDSIYGKYFDVVVDGKKVQVTKKTDLPSEVYTKETVVSLTLVATVTGGTATTRSVVNIKINYAKTNEDSIEFDSFLYNGKYEIKDNVAAVSVDPITIIANEPDKIEVVVNNNYKDYFNASYSDTKVTITLAKDIPDIQNIAIISILLKASIKDTDNEAAAVINLRIINDDSPTPDVAGTILFNTLSNTAQYSLENDKFEFKLDQTIGITTDRTNDEIETSITDELGLKDYFNSSYSNQEFKIELLKDLPEDLFASRTFASLILTATIKGTDTSANAVLTITFINDNAKQDSIQFDSYLYNGKYEIDNNVVTIDVDPIKIITDQPNNVEVTIANSYNEYFETSYSNSEVTLTLSKNIPNDIIQDISTVSILLKASIKDTTIEAGTVINLRIVSDDSPTPDVSGTITFKNLTNNAQYSLENNQGTLKLDEAITVTTDKQNEEIETNIADELGISEYFNSSYSNQEFKIQLLKNLPENIFISRTFVSLILTAAIKGTDKSASAVLTITINNEAYQDSLKFDSFLYNGIYEIKDNIYTVTVDPISIITNQPNNIEVNITNSYKEYFNVSYSNSAVTLSLTKNIPNDIVQDISTISILIQASIKNTEVKSTAVVNLGIISDDSPTPEKTGTISFNSVSNTAQYSLENNKGVFKPDHVIGITTDKSNDEIETSITDDSGLKDYFNSSYSNQEFKIELSKDLPGDVFSQRTFVSLILTATIKDTSKSTSAVLIISLINDRVINTGFISFESQVYAATYEITDKVAAITDIDVIVIDTDQGDGNVTVSITNGYDSVFDVTYLNGEVSMGLRTSTPSNTLRTLNNIPVVLLAQIKDSMHNASTVVNFKVKDNDNSDVIGNSSISFAQLLYQGSYILKTDKKVAFSVDDVSVMTDRTDNEIQVTMENEYGYEKYFSVSYTHKEASIGLKETLPEQVLKEMDFLAFTLKATVKEDDSIHCEAVLTIKLINQNDEEVGTSSNTTGYIIALSVLVVLFVLFVAAAAAYYYFKLRNYNKMTEDEYINKHVKFDKSSRTSGDRTHRSASLENRRPTGYIFNSNALNDDIEPKESTTDPTETPERKKSVAFDEHVEKLQLDGITDEDIEKGLEDSAEKIEN